MPSAKITSKGQVTLPKQVREQLRLKPGDRVDFVVGEDGQVRLKAGRLHVSELKGLLHEPDRPAVSLEEMEEAIARRHGGRE